MKTIKDLGALVKKKYKGYSHLSDREAGKLVKSQYPNAYSDFLDENEIDNPYLKQIEQLVEYYNPNQGRLSSWLQRGDAESEVKLLNVLSERQLAVLKLAAEYEQSVMQGKKHPYEFQSFVALHYLELGEIKVKEQLILRALREGYTLDNWQIEVAKRDEHKRDMQKMRLMYSHEKAMLKIQLQAKLSDSVKEVEIYREKEAIKLNNQLEEWRQRMRFSIAGDSMDNHEKLIMAQEKLDAIYEQIEDIKKRRFTEETKRRMIEDREKIIEQLSRYRDSLEL